MTGSNNMTNNTGGGNSSGGGDGGIGPRMALILFGSFVVAILGGILTDISTHNWAGSVITGAVAFAGAAFFFDWLIKKN
jgi:hypothetical protein